MTMYYVIDQAYYVLRSDEEKKAMVDMLKQFEENCEADEQELSGEEERAKLAERMEGIDLGEYRLKLDVKFIFKSDRRKQHISYAYFRWRSSEYLG